MTNLMKAGGFTMLFGLATAIGLGTAFKKKDDSSDKRNDNSGNASSSEDTANISEVYPDPDSLAINANLDTEQTFDIGSCNEIAVTLIGKDGNATLAKGDIVVDLSSNSTQGLIFSDAECKSPTTTTKFSKDEAYALIYFKSGVAGNYSLTATTKSSSLKSGSTKMMVSAPTALTLSADKTGLDVGACEAFYVAVKNAQGQEVRIGQDLGVKLVASSKTMEFYEDSSCEGPATTSSMISQGYSSTAFFAKDKTATVGTITVQTTGNRSLTEAKIDAKVQQK